MKNYQVLLQKVGYFVAALVLFYIISTRFMSPALDGKVLKQGDMQQVRLMRAYADTVKAQNGEFANWNDRLFSGMPANLITGIPQESLILKHRVIEIFGFVKAPFSFLFLAMMSMYILLLVAGVDKFLSVAGAIGYGFMTFSISSYEAGHITKVLSMAVMPGSIAGLLLLSRAKYFWGASLLALFFGVLVSYFHYQIAFYMGIIIAVFMVVLLVKTIKDKQWMHFLKVGGFALLAIVLGTITCIGKIADTMQYSKATMRGGSEVSSEVPKDGPKMVNATGLDIDYAFNWSYGIGETMTLLVPRFKGGSSDEPVPDNEMGVDRLPTYFGEMQFTSGPVYMGAISMYLFILGIVFAINWRKWTPESQETQNFFYVMLFSGITFLVSLMLAWGKFFPLNEWLFYHLPYYNKFRTPMMALVIAQVIVPFFGFYALYKMITTTFSAENTKSVIRLSTVVAVALFGIVLVSASSQKFSGLSDAEIAKSSGQEAITFIKDMRSKLLWNDVWRMLMFVVLALALVYGAVKKQIKPIVVSVVMIVLVAVDMLGVSGRYLSDDNWEEAETENEIVPSKLDEQIMADNKTNARVFDLRYSPFNDNHAAPFHRNVGGYHPAKLSRYQDIISFGITKNGEQLSSETIMNNNVLDMLNCKYVLTRDNKSGVENVMLRSTTLGNAWFVDSVSMSNSPKEALMVLNRMNAKNTAVVEAKEQDKPSKATYGSDTSRSIKITSYSLDTIKYQANNSQEGLAIFSEVYYNEKNGGWKVYIDGKPAKALRANYILRAVEIPAGNHSVVWIYEPADRSLFLNVEMASSALILLAFFGLLIKQLKDEYESTVE